MAIFKNVSSQKIAVFAWDTANDTEKTGDAANITAQISKDGGATAATNDTNPTELDPTDAPGIYIFDMTQAETNADLIILSAVSGTADIKIEPVIIYTLPTWQASQVAQTGDSYTRLGAPAGASVSADIAAIEAQTDDIGAAGVGLTAIPWNPDWDAEVQSEVADALAVYDPPTNAELTSEINAVQADIAALNNLSAAQVNAEVDTALADIRLDELLAADSDIDGAAPPTVGSVFHELMSKTAGSFTYDQTTDSNEALRDRGDAAWITATGFSTLSQADIRTAVGLASNNLDTQLAALPTASENADAVWEEPIADHSGTAGSTAEALNAAGAAGDPWTTALPGAYGAGSAGNILGNNLNATVSSRSSHSAADVWSVGTRTLTSFGTLVSDIWSAVTRTLTAGTNIVLAKGTGVTGFNDLSAAQVNSEVDQALADYDAPTNAELVSEINSVQSDIAALNNLSAAQVWASATRTLTSSLDPTAAAIVSQLLATTIEGRTFEEMLKDVWAQTVGDSVADDATTPTSITYEGPDGNTQVTHTVTPTTRTRS